MDCSRGAAFILEGDTEKVFYLQMIQHFCSKYPGSTLEKQMDAKTGEVSYVVSNNDQKTLVKMYVVGTVSQITNSGTWFENRCHSLHSSLPWTAFLCYDTDDYQENITKFHEGDWEQLRKNLGKDKDGHVVDLASSADIEDTMLLDAEGVFKYIGIEPVPIPSGSKGKRRMKKLFRMKGSGNAYHEGERARPLIESLDFDRIIEKSPIPFSEIEATLFL